MAERGQREHPELTKYVNDFFRGLQFPLMFDADVLADKPQAWHEAQLTLRKHYESLHFFSGGCALSGLKFQA